MKGMKKSSYILVGRVVSDKIDKSVTVLVERRVKHPLYKKYIRRSTKLHVCDDKNICRKGDIVSVFQCRPVSKTKTWYLQEVVARAH
uniref:Small ribosomal subunit protein uS17 n=1 Tax=Candidatus Kentrum sp. TC TaxID=2126339 RepID=A0A451A5K4_9GAMM|nr:MAG: small subunit ribosomal protein S17 [Candidatus Kentron sp. TC]VFK48071.1 MAG: SSU ribosomal protein S17P [Candidatus Kentron sp. TC]VFK61325.1 MAG: small subunit ribosomal protein S17 [Candidatus Kentron sp. TC]